MTAKGALASNELTRALINIAARGERTHCSDPETHHYWLSEHDTGASHRHHVVRPLPVLTVCRDTAEQRDERWGVWGGVDRSVRPGRRKAA